MALLSPPLKRQRQYDTCRKDDDRLSSLSNDVLVNILSWLPTKSAVTTSVLSRSWRYLWTQITALRFTTCDLSTYFYNRVPFVSFRQIPWQKINLLELIVVNSTSKCNIDALVGYTLFFAPNVKELRVRVEIGDDLVPRCIFERPSLHALEMDGLMIRALGSNHSLPKLRKLVINVRNCDLLYLENVLNFCPSLELLRLAVNAEKLTHRIEIKSQNLKSVYVNLVDTVESCNVVMIDAPKLEYLEVNSLVLLNFYFPKTLCGLSRAKLSMGGYSTGTYPSLGTVNSNQILMLLNPISQVKTLCLSGDHVLYPLSYTTDNKLKMFQKLTRVEIKLGSERLYDYWSVSGTWKFLKACPNLKSLVLRRKHGTLYWVKRMFSFMFDTADFESTSTCAGDLSRRFDDMKLIGDLDRVEKDGKIMVEITVHVYQNDDQFIYYAKGFVLPNQLWHDLAATL